MTPTVVGDVERRRRAGAPRRLCRTLGHLALAVVCGAAGACRTTSAGGPLETTPVSRGPAALATTVDRWQGIDPGDRQTQRLVTLNYRGPEGDGTLRLALRLADETRFSVQGTDRLGRRWFRLSVHGEEATLLDLREKTFCRFTGDVEILAIPLGPLSFSRLPALLLGRLPTAAREAAETEAGEWSFRDDFGRRWTARFGDGRLESWTLWRDGEPEVYWGHRGELSFLSSRSQELQLRWRSSRAQPLAQAPASLDVPEGFGAGECD